MIKNAPLVYDKCQYYEYASDTYRAVRSISLRGCSLIDVLDECCGKIESFDRIIRAWHLTRQGEDLCEAFEGRNWP